MKLSIITITYNSSSTLRDTIESVLNQSYKNIEYIIIDGLSTDNTIDIIQEYEPLFDGKLKWKSESDKGIYDAMNKGVLMATGEIVGILNSDDFYASTNVLQTIAETFEKDTKIDAIFGNLYIVDKNNTDKIIRQWKGSPVKPFNTGWHPAHPTFYAKKKTYDFYGLYDTTFDISADFELMLRFIEKFKIHTKFIDETLVHMRSGGESMRNFKNIFIGNRNIINAFHKHHIPISLLYPIRRIMPKIIDYIRRKVPVLTT